MYGPYLDALARFLTQDSCKALSEALAQHFDKQLSIDAVRSVDLISRKHGALYNVAEVRVLTANERCSLALNTAVGPHQQTVLSREFRLLEDLWKRFGLPFLPRPYFLGEAPLDAGPGAPGTVRLFLAEWFEGYNEFHLSSEEGNPYPVTRVWDAEYGRSILGPDESNLLYRKASAILTAYFNEQSFTQIYPWHHAAGDFVLKLRNGELDVRLVTARDCRSLLPGGGGPEDNLFAAIHFFLNLSIRMRLDRWDGTGRLAWASPSCLQGVITGFLQSWEGKVQKTAAGLPSASDILALLRGFSADELSPLAEIVVENGLLEADEIDFLNSRIEEHVLSLYKSLHEEP
jgi:hypothetical protein